MHFDISRNDFSFFSKILHGPLYSRGYFSICRSVQPSPSLCPAPPRSSEPPAARRSARLLLAAWNSTDLRQIQNAIDQARAIEITRLSGAEVERMELVRAIGVVMREWMAGHRTGTDLKASLDLLHHLANLSSGGSSDARVAFR